jgi:glycosyltransferase involved in cell wall biosynthesis
MRRARLAVVASHPIPYQAPLFARLAKDERLSLMVFFGDDYGVRPRRSWWGVDDFVWDGDLASNYPHVFLPNWARRPDASSFLGKLNPGLVPAVLRFRPDAVLLTGYASLYHLLGIAASQLGGARKLYVSDASQPAPPGWRGTVKHAILSRLYGRMDRILVIGARSREHYRSYGVPDAKMVWSPYSVGNARFRAQSERLHGRRAELRAEFGVPVDATCVSCVGRLSPEKNVAELVRGVAGLPRGFLLVAGSGPLAADLTALAERLLPGRHRFAGFLNQDRLAEVYAAADVMALCSTFEPWGLVLNEAMNFGLPLVVSDRVGAGPDLVTAGETGFVYPLGDVAALSRALADVGRMLATDRAAVAAAVLRRVDRYSEDAQALGVLRALGPEGDAVASR